MPLSSPLYVTISKTSFVERVASRVLTQPYPLRLDGVIPVCPLHLLCTFPPAADLHGS